jgi:hypothetical protein
MGPVQSALNQTITTAGVAGRIAIGSISEANDATKARAAKKRALENMKQAKEDKQTLKKESQETVQKLVNRADQNDPKARAELRDLGGM